MTDSSPAGKGGPSARPEIVDKSFSREVVLALQRYVDILVSAGVDRGLVGPREIDRIWDRHILNCAAIAPAFEVGVSVADVGSGAGLPGVVLAIVRPDLSITLLDSLERRIAFLDEVRQSLSLANVAIVRSRAEDYSGARFDAVTARAVAPLDRLVSWTLPLLKPGGHLLAIKGARASEELTQHATRIMQLGGTDAVVLTMGGGGGGLVDPPATVVRVTAVPRPRARRR